MSQIVDYIRSAVDSYVLREIGVDEFREAFAGAYFYVRNNAAEDQEAQRLASKLMAPVAEFSSGHRAEASLRLELANAIRPFEVVKILSYSPASFGMQQQPQFPTRPGPKVEDFPRWTLGQMAECPVVFRV